MGDITHVYKSNYLLTLISTSFNHFNWGSYMGIYHKKDDIFVLYLCVMAQRHAIIIIIIICCWWWLKCHLPLVQKLLPSDLHWQSVEGVFALVFLFYFSAYDITQSSQSARCLNRRMRVAVVSPTRRYWSLDVKFQAFEKSLEIISNSSIRYDMISVCIARALNTISNRATVGWSANRGLRWSKIHFRERSKCQRFSVISLAQWVCECIRLILPNVYVLLVLSAQIYCD